MEDEIKKNILKTGTTTLGIVTKEGLVLGADNRVTYGGDGGIQYIAGKDQKIFNLNEDIIVTIAGVMSDLHQTIKLVRAELRLKELKDKKKPTLRESASLLANISFQKIRQPSMIPSITHFLLAGRDLDGSVCLFDVTMDGALKKINSFAATGSGMVQINPVLDNEWKPGMSLKEGISLAEKCLKTSPRRDPASGDGLDIFTVTKDGIKQVSKQRAEPVYTEEKQI
jgi:proteasome beta subunit